MYHVSAQGVHERMINLHYYYYFNSPLLGGVEDKKQNSVPNHNLRGERGPEWERKLAPSTRPQGSVHQTTRLRPPDHKAGQQIPSTGLRHPSSKKLTATKVLPHGHGARLSDSSTSTSTSKATDCHSPCCRSLRSPRPPQPDSGLACYVVMTAGCDGPQNRVRFCCRCSDE